MITKMKSTKPIQTLITMAEYSRRKGVSRAAISKHVKSGKITLVKGKIDPVMSDKQLKANLDISQKRKVKLSDDDVGDELNLYQKARARREKYKAELAKLEYEQKAGLLVYVREVQDEAETLYRSFRDQMLNIPNRMSQKVAAENDEFKVREMLKKEIQNSIKKFCNELSGRTVGH